MSEEAVKDEALPEEVAGQEEKEPASQSGGEASEVTETKAEQEASKYGWLPKGKYEGDEWVTAETFLERRKWLNQLHQSNRKIRNLETQLKNVNDLLVGQSAASIEDSIAALEAKRDEAIEMADVAAVKKYDATINKLATRYAELKKEPAKTDEPAPEAKEWYEENKHWFNNDTPANSAMAAFARSLDSRLAAKGWDVPDILKEIDRQVREEFPHKFKGEERPARKAPAHVATPSHTQTRSVAKSYKDLPKEAKEVADQFAEAGIMTRDEYAKDYFTE